MFNQQQYHVGDFIYVANKDMPGGESKIFLIEKIYRTNPHLSNGVWMMAVNQFFRYSLYHAKLSCLKSRGLIDATNILITYFMFTYLDL